MGGPGRAERLLWPRKWGADVPGYRGLCSLVLRQVYLGINPYLKPWAVRVTRVLEGEAGAEQWYPETAPIVPEAVSRTPRSTSRSTSRARCPARAWRHKRRRWRRSSRDRGGRGLRMRRTTFADRAVEFGGRGHDRAARHGGGGLRAWRPGSRRSPTFTEQAAPVSTRPSAQASEFFNGPMINFWQRAASSGAS